MNIPKQVDECVSKVEISVECKNLLNKDTLSKSDPCAVLYMSRGNGQMTEVCILCNFLTSVLEMIFIYLSCITDFIGAICNA